VALFPHPTKQAFVTVVHPGLRTTKRSPHRVSGGDEERRKYHTSMYLFKSSRVGALFCLRRSVKTSRGGKSVV